MTPEEEARLRLLSDGPLMEEAITFAAGRSLPASQINGLLAFSHGEWSELERYVRHQAERNWPEQRGGGTHPIKVFYSELRDKLGWLRRQAQDWGFVPQGLTKAETQKQTARVAARLAREYIQHLAAELQYRKGER